MAPELCPGCGCPILPESWARSVAITRDGARAHLACLERGLPVPIHVGRADRPWFLLAGRTCSPRWLRPGARFQELRGDVVIIAVPESEIWPQCEILETVRQTRAHFPFDGIFAHLADARTAALPACVAAAPETAVVRGIWGDGLPY